VRRRRDGSWSTAACCSTPPPVSTCRRAAAASATYRRTRCCSRTWTSGTTSSTPTRAHPSTRTRRWSICSNSGPCSTDEIRSFLDKQSIAYQEFDEDGMIDATVQALEDQKTIGWYQGRMEFGPRALGARSIIADARNPENKSVVNLKIKFRESFRPFAPSVLEEKCSEWFDLDIPSPYRLLVADVREGKRTIPSVTHVDNSARIQTVNHNENPRYYKLIQRFDQRTGCPLIINTSFNVRGEPIVCTPNEAYLCFMRTNMDVLVLDRFVMYKDDQKPLEEDVDWRTLFALD
jgi:carbamoyltransferase